MSLPKKEEAPPITPNDEDSRVKCSYKFVLLSSGRMPTYPNKILHLHQELDPETKKIVASYCQVDNLTVDWKKDPGMTPHGSFEQPDPDSMTKFVAYWHFRGEEGKIKKAVYERVPCVEVWKLIEYNGATSHFTCHYLAPYTRPGEEDKCRPEVFEVVDV